MSILPFFRCVAMSLLSLAVLHLLLLLLSLSSTFSAPDVVFTLNADHTSTLRVNGEVWLHSAATWFHALNQTFSTEDSSLALSSTKEHIGPGLPRALQRHDPDMADQVQSSSDLPDHLPPLSVLPFFCLPHCRVRAVVGDGS